MINILVVEDDNSLRTGIALGLGGGEYSVFGADCISEARNFISQAKPDLMILDINLPDGNGIDFLTELRRTSDIPVIILTANDMESDIVVGLESGADDYITKPFSLAVLRARVRNQLKKKTSMVCYKIDDFVFDFENMCFKVKEHEIELSKTEQKLLRVLIENKPSTVTREVLLDKVWGNTEFIEENALSVTVKRLRDKIDPKTEYIKTVYGLGYRWTVEK